MNRIGNKIGGILGSRICKGGDVQFYTSITTGDKAAIIAAAACGAGDHGIDVVDVVLIVLRDRPAKLCFQIGIRLI